MTHKIQVDALVFDLDGTLIESKWDIAKCVNLTLKDLGLSLRTEEEIFGFVGDGIKRLLCLAVGEDNHKAYNEALGLFRGHYLTHCLDRTRFYPGVEEVLVYFSDKQKAIATNKSIEYTQKIVEGLGAHHFACLVGGDDGYGLKPEPAMLYHIMDKLGASPEKTVLIGDSTNDIKGGHHAGIRVCAVGYGMGNREKMASCKPDWFIEQPSEIMGLFS